MSRPHHSATPMGNGAGWSNPGCRSHLTVDAATSTTSAHLVVSPNAAPPPNECPHPLRAAVSLTMLFCPYFLVCSLVGFPLAFGLPYARPCLPNQSRDSQVRRGLLGEPVGGAVVFRQISSGSSVHPASRSASLDRST